MSKCNCKICIVTDRLRWATISECQCDCHTSDHINGHDELCCAYPNGKKKDNPYEDELKDKHFYQQQLNSLFMKGDNDIY